MLRKDIARARIRHAVKNVLEYRQFAGVDVREFKKVFDKNSSRVVRLVWLCITLLCTGLCITQIVDRVLWFLSHPVAVDVSLRNVDVIDMFRVKIYSAENQYISQAIHRRGIANMLGIEKPFIHAKLLRYNDTDVSKLWSYENNSNLIENVWNKNMSKKFPCRPQYDVSFLGQWNEIDLSKSYLVNGIHLVFRRKQANDVRRAIVAYVNEISTFTVADVLYGNGNYIWTMRLRQYRHLSVPNKPCVEEHMLKKCYINCIITELKSTTKCRLPFHHKKLSLPVCNNVDDAKASYQKTAELYIQPDLYGKCNCVRSCNKITFITLREDITRYWHTTMLTLVVDKTEISMTERHAYDEISLLTDIGGNLGLFIGLSLLSGIDLFLRIIITARKKNLLIRKIKPHQHYQPIMSCLLQQERQNLSSTTNKTTLSNNSKLGVQIICWIIAIFMIQERIKHYFQYPVRLIVEVEAKLSVTMPSITVCGVSENLRFRKTQYAKKNNISDWCTVDLLDLHRESSGFNLEKLWKMTHAPPVSLAESVIQNFLNLTMTKPINKTARTHLGDCTHYKFESTKHLGYITIFPIIYVRSQAEKCPNLANKLFTDDIGSESYNILTASTAPLNLNSIYDFSFTIMTRLNTPTNPCISKETYKECKKQCLKKEISVLNICSLPFLTNESVNLPPCNSMSTIKKSLHNYTVALIKITNGVNCFCSRLCEETVLSQVNSVMGKSDSLMYSISISMTSNTFEYIIEVEDYKLVSLFCDIGNSLGIALGMSVLSVVSFIQESAAVYKVLRRRLMNCWLYQNVFIHFWLYVVQWLSKNYNKD